MDRRQRHLHALIAALGLAGAACVGGPAVATGPAPTYGADVAPRLARSCGPCHDGRAGPPALLTLDDARRHGAAMVFAVDSGLMPPGGIDRSGACGTFVGPLPFTDEDAAVLSAWVEAGMPAGPTPRGADVPAPPAPPEGQRVVEVVLPLLPDTADAHRCFVVDPGLDAPAYLAGIGVQGGSVVHHAMVFATPDRSAGVARALDAADPAPGWSCPGVPQGAGTLLATWVPGRSDALFPEGAGAALAPGPLLVQVHQHGEDLAPEARLSVHLVDEVRWPVRTVPIAATDFLLPPGDDDVAIERIVPLPLGEDTLVLGVMPHLHAAGRAVSLAVEAGPCLVDAPRYDFGWQELAFYELPVGVGAGTRATLSCRWDTRDRSVPTPWGESSDDEMCTVFLFVTD